MAILIIKVLTKLGFMEDLYSTKNEGGSFVLGWVYDLSPSRLRATIQAAITLFLRGFLEDLNFDNLIQNAQYGDNSKSENNVKESKLSILTNI